MVLEVNNTHRHTNELKQTHRDTQQKAQEEYSSAPLAFSLKKNLLKLSTVLMNFYHVVFIPTNCQDYNPWEHVFLQTPL